MIEIEDREDGVMGDSRVSYRSRDLRTSAPSHMSPSRHRPHPERPRVNETERRVLEERDRIARDLHDIVIQRLFAAGIGLQSVSTRLSDPVVAEEIERTKAHLDESIREIRAVIFGISTRSRIGSGLRAEILRVLSDEEDALGFEPRIHLDGIVEAIPDDVSAHLIATLREALSNVARHARASSVEVFIDARDGVVLRVVDNGVGPPDRPGSGLGISNITARAAALGGSLHLASNPDGGTTLAWSAPT